MEPDHEVVFQFQMPAGRRLRNGEERIKAAVLHQAFCDLDPGKIYSSTAGASRKADFGRHERIAKEARWWFERRNEPEDPYHFTLADICEALGLNVAVVRAKAREILAGAAISRRPNGGPRIGALRPLEHPWTGRTREAQPQT